MTKKYEDIQVAQIEAGRALAAFDKNVSARIQMGDEPNPVAIERERLKLITHIRVLDEQAVSAFREYLAEGDARAQKLRASAEVETNSAKRLADLQEAKMLIESNIDGAEFLRRAAAMLDNGQVERADFLLGVAEAKRARPDGVLQLRGRVNAALDETVEDRKKAAAIERELDAEDKEFFALRGRILAVTVGVKENGEVGLDEEGQRASARAASKLADFYAKQARGEQYSAPVGDGSNTDRDNASMVRAASPRLIEQDRFESGQGGES